MLVKDILKLEVVRRKHSFQEFSSKVKAINWLIIFLGLAIVAASYFVLVSDGL